MDDSASLANRHACALPIRLLPAMLSGWVLCAVVPALCQAVELEEAQQLFRTGKYEQVLTAAEEEVKDGTAREEWWQLKIETLLVTGQYAEAKECLEKALGQFRTSAHLRLIGYDVYRANGDPQKAGLQLAETNALVQQMPWRYSDVANLVTLGRTALAMGADAREVLELFYDRARKAVPDYRETYLAAGQLALGKHDDAVAAEEFQAGLKKFEDDPDLLFGLAQALSGSNSLASMAALAKVLEINPRHVDALLYQVDHLVDSEKYDEAQQLLDKVLAINPRHAEAWSYLAVLAHLQGDFPGEQLLRETALRNWPTNPEVDHLIGQKLSQKYRFAEGAEHQRQALKFDPDFLPAKWQLCQDLLRLGQEDAGWKLAHTVHEQDGYDVVAFNLVTLRESLDKFRTLENDDFIVRMDAREADIYGPRVLALLDESKRVLCQKYGLALNEKVTVEIFPDQKDFAVRTFGIPGGSGYLGVCFGRVITANSPASRRGAESNWEAVLWHEFCHVVTLELTRNRMPRWLSEGISVYEERQANPAWGQSMNLQYQQMVREELTPVGELSSAFLRPKSGMHLQFAYYESSMVVEFLIDRFGLEPLKRMLHDLGRGLQINDVLARHTGMPLAKLESAFETYIIRLADELAPELDLEVPKDFPRGATSDMLAEWLQERPNNFIARLAYAQALIREKKWAAAKKELAELKEQFPSYIGSGSPYGLLAAVHRQLGETDAELAVLNEWAARDADALEGYGRLMELYTQREDWKAVKENAERYLAVDPLVTRPHQYLAEASDALGDREQAIEAYHTVLILEPENPAKVHFRLAELLRPADAATAKRHVLMALEEAPRFRDAHRLLLDMVRAEADAASPSETNDEAR